MRHAIALLTVVMCAGLCLAETHKIGPAPNFKGIVDQPALVVVPTLAEWEIEDPHGGLHKVGGQGGGTYEVTVPTPVFAASYVEFESSEQDPFDPQAGSLLLTEVWAFDLDPGVPPELPQLLGGFNPGLPEFTPLQDWAYTGLSSTPYPAMPELLPLAMLPDRLPGYDLSAFVGDPTRVVWLIQTEVPAFDFIERLNYVLDYLGYIEEGNPDWWGPFNPEYPYQHMWHLEILTWGAVDYINDVHIEEPTVINPGYIEVVPPPEWHSTGIIIGRYGYEANSGAELSAGGGSMGIDLRVNGKVPEVIPGTVYLTKDTMQVGEPRETSIVDSPPPEPFHFSFEYVGAQYVGGEFPHEHTWELNIAHWDPLVPKVTDIDIEAPHIIPGYVEVIPPANWAIGPWYIGRYSYEANPGNEIVNEGRYTDWKVRAKTPYVVPGTVVLTNEQQVVSPAMYTVVPGPALEGFNYSYDYVGYTIVDDEYPYEHTWELNIEQWDPQVPKVTDVDIEAPHIIPGYVKIIPPPDWTILPIEVGRYGYEANPQDPIVNEGRYTDWKVRAKTPYVVPGTVYLTDERQIVSTPVETVVPGPALEGFNYSYDYVGYTIVDDEYPYEHAWELNIEQWDPQVPKVTDVDIEAPHIIPGYVKIIPPPDWTILPIEVGRYGYEANPQDPIVNEGRYTDWKVRAKTPYVVPGTVYLTDERQIVSTPVETMVPGPDPQLVDFEYEHVGAIEPGNPDWRGPVDPRYPFQHIWQLHINDWGDIDYISDIDIVEPITIYPGYIQVVPPENWVVDPITVGRYGYQANPGAEISVGGGSLGIDWRVNAKTPAIVPGQVYLTRDSMPISPQKRTMIPAATPQCGDWGYLPGDINRDCKVNLTDVAMLAEAWLRCTEPGDDQCEIAAEMFVGVGFAFDGESDGPAQVAFLYDPLNAGVVHPGDVILEYRGMPIASGAELQAAILILPLLAVGEPVPMRVDRDGQIVDVEPVAGEIPARDKEPEPCSQGRCAKIIISGGGPSQDQSYCQCVKTGPQYESCMQWLMPQMIWIMGEPAPRMIIMHTGCLDSGGNSCSGRFSSG